MKYLLIASLLLCSAISLTAQDATKGSKEKSNTTTVIDFTDPNTAVFGTDTRVIVNGVALLRAGDVNSDGVVDALDYSNPNNTEVDWLSNNGKLTDYLINGGADLNLDGFINAIDLNYFWFPNLGQSEQLPQSTTTSQSKKE